MEKKNQLHATQLTNDSTTFTESEKANSKKTCFWALQGRQGLMSSVSQKARSEIFFSSYFLQLIKRKTSDQKSKCDRLLPFFFAFCII